MKYLFILISVVIVNLATAQSTRKTENIFIITLDGFRWQELFSGADSALMKNKTFTEDTEAIMTQFWKDTPVDRRKILLPFFGPQ